MIETTEIASPQDPLEKLLHERFGFSQFRKGQRAIIESVLAGRDTLAVMPTGGGKSLCYQIPALAKVGRVLVISPLISLMKDQVRSLRALKIPAGAIHSGQEPEEKRAVFEEMSRERHFVLYISPERVQTEAFAQWLNVNRGSVSLIAIDESHCISQWGPDFREDYHRLSLLRRIAPGIPVLALTATATPPVLRDIVNQLDLKDPEYHVHGFYRPNLYYQAAHCESEHEKYAWMEQALNQTPEGRIIIYCGTRKQTREIAQHLAKLFDGVKNYHAGLTPESRTKIQSAFDAGKVRILVATNAFGMGIDHPDVRLVVHFQIPANIESLYQEMGRAGRDGQPSTCLLLYSKKDKGLHSYFIMKSDAPREITRARWRALETLCDYVEVNECRHAGILTYFKDPSRMKACGHCDVCDPRSPQHIETPSQEAPSSFAKAAKKKKGKAPTDDTPMSAQQTLCFETLRAWRKSYADAHDVPAFVVLSNKSLEALVKRLPTNAEELTEVFGFGPKKVEHIGAEVLKQLEPFHA